MGGVNWDGKPFQKVLHVSEGRVQPLWIGVEVPQDASPGDYQGSVVVQPKNCVAQHVAVTVTVLPSVMQDHGDSEPWRHTRLRWLDSTIAMDDEVVAPYTPLKLNDRTLRCLGREVRFGEGFEFNEMSPDTWLVEASGIPFGLMGEILAQHGYSPWQGMIYGMSCRGVNPLWTLWDDFGIDESKMTGYWEPDCPVRTNHADVLTTVYTKKNKALVAVASSAEPGANPYHDRLAEAWGGPRQSQLATPAIDGMQDAKKLGFVRRYRGGSAGGLVCC